MEVKRISFKFFGKILHLTVISERRQSLGDFSKVDFEKTEIILKFKRKATDTKTIEIRLNEGENEVCVGNSSYFYWRKYTLSKTGVVIASGGYTSTYPEIKADNSCAIPIELKKSGGGY